MSEVLKKAGRKIRGIPEAKLIIDPEPFVANLLNVEFKILRNYKPIEELPKPLIVCQSCGKKFDEKWVKREVHAHGITARATRVDTHGKKNELLIEWKKKVKERKISATEAFAELDRIQNLYSNYPMDERDISSVTAHIPLKCPQCESPLGLVDVHVTTKPAAPALPDFMDFIVLPKTPRELKLIHEYLQLPKDMDFDAWIAGEDIIQFVNIFKAWSKELEGLRFIRTLYRPISDLDSALRSSIEAIEKEIKTRVSRTYNLLREPRETRQALERAKEQKSEIELMRGQKAAERMMKELGAKKISRR